MKYNLNFKLDCVGKYKEGRPSKLGALTDIMPKKKIKLTPTKTRRTQDA